MTFLNIRNETRSHPPSTVFWYALRLKATSNCKKKKKDAEPVADELVCVWGGVIKAMGFCGGQRRFGEAKTTQYIALVVHQLHHQRRRMIYRLAPNSSPFKNKESNEAMTNAATMDLLHWPLLLPHTTTSPSPASHPQPELFIYLFFYVYAIFLFFFGFLLHLH